MAFIDFEIKLIEVTNKRTGEILQVQSTTTDPRYAVAAPGYASITSAARTRKLRGRPESFHLERQGPPPRESAPRAYTHRAASPSREL